MQSLKHKSTNYIESQVKNNNISLYNINDWGISKTGSRKIFRAWLFKSWSKKHNNTRVYEHAKIAGSKVGIRDARLQVNTQFITI